MHERTYQSPDRLTTNSQAHCNNDHDGQNRDQDCYETQGQSWVELVGRLGLCADQLDQDQYYS